MSSTLEATSTTASERVCYVHCTFCNTVLAVSVPCSSMYTMVTVRCGHCSNLLSVNMGAALQQTLVPPQHHQDLQQKQNQNFEDPTMAKDCGSSSSSSSKCNKFTAFESPEAHQPTKMPPIPQGKVGFLLYMHINVVKLTSTTAIMNEAAPEKRQRIPSAYNRFIKEEIQRIKATNPEISHREAFSTAAKNWAHFPHIHFGLKLEGNKRAKMDESFTEEETIPKPNEFY